MIRNEHNQIGHHMGSDKHTSKHHIQKGPEVSLFPAGYHKAARHRQDSLTDKHETNNKITIHKRITVSERSVRKYYWRA